MNTFGACRAEEHVRCSGLNALDESPHHERRIELELTCTTRLQGLIACNGEVRCSPGRTDIRLQIQLPIPAVTRVGGCEGDETANTWRERDDGTESATNLSIPGP